MYSSLYWLTSEVNEEHQYIQVGFFQNKVILENIEIYTARRDFFKSYTIYGINNGENEEEIDHISPKPEDIYDDPVSRLQYNFQITNKDSWNNIKIVPNGERAAGDYRFVIHKLELYGYFITNNCRTISKKSDSIFFFLSQSINIFMFNNQTLEKQ